MNRAPADGSAQNDGLTLIVSALPFFFALNFVLILTLVGTSLLLSILKVRFHGLARLIDGLPVMVVSDGKVLKDRMNKLNVDEDDVLEAARTLHGLERMDQVKHAVVERGGDISVVPK